VLHAYSGTMGPVILSTPSKSLTSSELSGLAMMAMPLAQSCGDPPPKEMTQSQPSATNWALPASTCCTVGLGSHPA
jgi:hypothetical protein